MKHVIYDSFAYMDYVDEPKELFPDLDDEEIRDLSQEEIWEEARRMDEVDLDAEVSNLSSIITSNMVAIGEIQRWNGGRRAYKMLKSINLGDAILEVMQAFGGDNRFVILVNDKGDVEVRQTGHDNPTNPSIISIRYVKESALRRFDDAEEAICGASDRALARRTEKFGKSVGDIYGWRIKA